MIKEVVFSTKERSCSVCGKKTNTMIEFSKKSVDINIVCCEECAPKVVSGRTTTIIANVADLIEAIAKEE